MIGRSDLFSLRNCSNVSLPSGQEGLQCSSIRSAWFWFWSTQFEFQSMSYRPLRRDEQNHLYKRYKEGLLSLWLWWFQQPQSCDVCGVITLFHLVMLEVRQSVMIDHHWPSDMKHSRASGKKLLSRFSFMLKERGGSLNILQCFWSLLLLLLLLLLLIWWENFWLIIENTLTENHNHHLHL